VLLNCLNRWLKYVLIKEDDTIDVEFRGKEVKKDILALALVQLRDGLHQLVKHRERLARVVLAGHHQPHLLLQLHHL
jgi:hypothetical protein